MGKSPKSTGSSAAGFRLTFVGLKEGETPPQVALYSLDDEGKATTKLAQAKAGMLTVPASQLKGKVAIGPDLPNLADVSRDRLLVFRAEQIAKVWGGPEGIILSKDRLGIIWPPPYCVSGKVRKCRPWWWDIIAVTEPLATTGIKASRRLALQSQLASRIALASDIRGVRYFPWRCVPLCDGIVEVYQKLCCCNRIIIDDLLDKLRDILERIPVPWPPEPDPGPWPGPDPLPDTHLLRPRIAAKAAAGTIALDFDHTAAPPQRLYEAYQDLKRLPRVEAERYVLERPYLLPYCCTCTTKKLGEVPIQPDGDFDFCFYRSLPPFRCYYTYAYRIRQFINGAWVTVYDGLAAGAWFADGEEADIRVTNPKALPCGDPSADPPPNEGPAFVMLEWVSASGTHHFNFPGQTGVSQVAPLDANDGLITTSYAPDCPWASSLGLRLWVSASLEGTVAYYRMSVMQVSASGSPLGPPSPLFNGVIWNRFVWNGTDWVVQSDSLGPVPVGTESNLFRVPYWSNGMYWLSGQAHQNWPTTLSANGKYLLIIELFGPTGQRIKPNGATGPGTGKAFQFRRWVSDTVTANVPFADCAHVFWIDNLGVEGDIVDLRQNGVASAAECQFMKGAPGDQFSIGYRAFHQNGVSNTDSFMYWHSIDWQRGLNGASGSLATAGLPTTDTGEGGPPGQSGSASFGSMLDLTKNERCTFSVFLRVYGKHTNGAGRLSAYDYWEPASFALDVS